MRSPRVGGAAHRDRDRGRPEFGRVRDESGNILVLFAVMLPLFLFCCAIVIDVGYWWANGKRAQVAADACALAAASKLPFSYPDDPECVITGTVASPTNPDYIFANLPGHTGEGGKANEPRWLSTVVTSPWAPDGAPNTADSYVRARVTIAVRTFFGRIIGKRVLLITRQAVAESAPGDMAIYARSRSCSDIGVRLNGTNMDIDGGVWSNGSFTANGNNIDAASTDVGGQNSCPPQTGSCPGCDLGNGTANPGIHNTYADWPIWFEEGDFTCNVGSLGDTSNDLKIEAGGPHVSGGVINSGVYCSGKEIKVEADNLTGTVTFLTPKLSLKKNHNFRAFANNVVVFATGTDEMVLNTDGSTFRGFLFHPGNSPSPTSDCPPSPQGRILLNGEFNTVIGMIAACEVHVNGLGFNMTGDGGQRVVALYE